MVGNNAGTVFCKINSIMIEILTKIHDKFSIEFKVGFVTRKKLRMNDFSLAMWFFVPGSLDITRSTYPKGMFYQDVKSNIRLIIPTFLLREIVDEPAVPLRNIRRAVTELASNPTRTLVAEYEYHIKMFVAIVKSALRDELAHIKQNRISSDILALSERFMENAERICDEYIRVRSIINAPTVSEDVLKVYLCGDEFLGDITCKRLLDLMSWLQDKGIHDLDAKAVALYRKIGEHKKTMGYPEVGQNFSELNKTYLYRFSMLKKYIESDLYLRAPKKRDGILVEQLYLSIAAGIAMLFATVVSYAFQKRFGSLTFPLFIALIISYMLKDRIKELMRFYFAHRVGSKYFDNKAKIIHKDTELGWMKEGVDFIEPDKISQEVLAIRKNSNRTEIEERIAADKVILYRKSVHIDREKLQEKAEYSFSGINDIIRLNVLNFIKKMDNPVIPINILDKDGIIRSVDCGREYFLNLVLQYKYDDIVEYKSFRIALSRDGIHSIEEIGRV